MLKRLQHLFARQPEPFPDLQPVTLHPIGVVRSKVAQPGDWRDWRSFKCRIVIRPELADALLGLDTYSHISVLFWPHQIPDDVRGSKPRLHPRDDPQNPLQGVLATRAQIRFNPILTTTVALLSVTKNVLTVQGLDAIDGTPVLDVKPYIPYFDAVSEAKVPAWLTEAANRQERRPPDK